MSPGLFSVFWPISTRLRFGWSPGILLFTCPQDLCWLYRAIQWQLISTSLLCPIIFLFKAYLKLSFYMVYVSCSVTDQEFIHIQSTVCSAIYVFHNIINFYIEQHDRQYTTLRYTHFLLFFFRENLSHAYSKSSILKEVLDKYWHSAFKSEVFQISYNAVLPGCVVCFFEIEKTATRCSFVIEASLMNVSNRIMLSIVLLWLLEPDWYSVINLLVSKYQINLAFTILSNVLQTHLLRVMGLDFLAFVLSSKGFGIGITVVSFHILGISPLLHKSLKICRRKFVDGSGNSFRNW